MPDSFVLGTQARADLDSIILHIAEQSHSVETAFRVDEKFHDAFRFLAETPHAGHTRTDILIPEKFLVWPVYSYLIIYRPDTQPIRILRVWHGKQNKPEIPES
jgi:plasmid stabilization system protein ParE